MIRINSDLFHLDHIDLDAVAVVVVQQGEPEALISARKLAALVTLCRHVAVRSGRVKQSRLMEFIEEAESVGVRRAG